MTQPSQHTLKPRETVLLYVLAIRAGEDGVSYHGTSTLAKQCGYGRNTLNEALRGLEAHGLVNHYRRPNRSNVYRLLKSGWLSGSQDNHCPACSSVRRPVRSRDVGGRLSGTQVNRKRSAIETSVSGPQDTRLTTDQDTRLSGSEDNPLSGTQVTELQAVELPEELKERTSAARDVRAGEGELSTSTEELQEASRAWVASPRETWGHGIDEDVALAVFHAAHRRGHTPEKDDLAYAQRFGPDSLDFYYDDREAA